MSLIKSADVPKHMADRLRSRRIAARLSGGAAKQAIVPAKRILPPWSPPERGPGRPTSKFSARSAVPTDWASRSDALSIESSSEIPYPGSKTRPGR